jgi:hypothetical protein
MPSPTVARASRSRTGPQSREKHAGIAKAERGPTYREAIVLASIAVGAGAATAGCCFASDPDLAAPIAAPEPTTAPWPTSEPPPYVPPPPPPPYVEAASLLAPPSMASSLEGSSLVPQRPDARRLFDRARPVEGAIHRGLLVCRTEIRGQYDDSLFAGGADVSMSLTVGAGEPMATGQESSRTYTFPIAALEPGTTLHLGAVDVDVLFSDPIGGVDAEYTRTPFEAEHPNVTFRCRALESVEAQAQAALARYRRALDGFAATSPELSALDLGYPSTAPVVEAAEEAASWLGWRDGDMRAGADRAREIDAAFVQRVGERVVSTATTLPSGSEPSERGDRRIRIARTVCDDEARAFRADMGDAVSTTRSPACHVVLEIEARRGLRLEGPPPSEAEAWTLREDGTREHAERLAIFHDGAWHRPNEPISLAAGEHCEVHLGVHEPGALLRVGGALSRIPGLLRFD